MDDLLETSCAHLRIFTHVSIRDGIVGGGLVVRVNQTNIVSAGRIIASEDALNAYYAQLGVVLEAVSCFTDDEPSHRDVAMEDPDHHHYQQSSGTTITGKTTSEQQTSLYHANYKSYQRNL
jgi:hypothetical protein